MTPKQKQLIENYIRLQVKKKLNENEFESDPDLSNLAKKGFTEKRLKNLAGQFASDCNWNGFIQALVFMQSLTESNSHSERRAINKVMSSVFDFDFNKFGG